MSTYNTQLQSNNTGLQQVLQTLQTKAAGKVLPELANPASESEIFLNKEAIDKDGNKLTGSFTIDSELTNIEELLTELETALENKSTYNTIYVGTSVPTADFGLDGDIYIVRSDSV